MIGNCGDCGDCEKEAIQDLINLQIEYDQLEEKIDILQKCLDTKEKLCKFYRDENDILKQNCKLWKEKAQKLENEVNNGTI